jgi:hypothetical protein
LKKVQNNFTFELKKFNLAFLKKFASKKWLLHATNAFFQICEVGWCLQIVNA